MVILFCSLISSLEKIKFDNLQWNSDVFVCLVGFLELGALSTVARRSLGTAIAGDVPEVCVRSTGGSGQSCLLGSGRLCGQKWTSELSLGRQGECAPGSGHSGKPGW